MDYKKAYLTLSEGVSDTIRFLEEDRVSFACKMLMMAQSRAKMLVTPQPSEEDELLAEDAFPR